MELKQLRLDMMKAKKSNPERAKVLQAILGSAQLIAKEDGNREVRETDIIQAAKQEAKMAKQSKDAGAPYSEETFIVTAEFLPKQMNDNELEKAILQLIGNTEKTPKIMGKIMGMLKKEYDGQYDGSVASKILKNILNS